MAITVLAAAILFTGCANESKDVADNDSKSDKTETQSTSIDDHSGWWCKPHAIPEEVCSMCSAAAAKKFKEEGDWCDEHNRAESQCFICDPSRAEKYAKLYEAKYGEQPPAAIE